jgi:hypothetical protein
LELDPPSSKNGYLELTSDGDGGDGRLMLYATCSSVFVVCHFLVAVVDFVYSGKTTTCVGEGNFTKVYEKKALS